MADAAAPSLGDFFKSKSKKKVKASNLNKAEEAKTEDKKKAESKEDDAWREDEVVAATIKVAVVGKLMREEEKVEEVSAPTWNVKKESASSAAVNEKRYPTLAKAVGSSSINIDDGSDAQVNIKTSKNRFADIAGSDDEEDGDSKRPKSIKPAHVTKKQGEREDVALQREVDKYKSKPTKKKSKEASADDSDEEEEEEDDEAEEDVEATTAKDEASKAKAKAKKEEKKAKKAVQEAEAAEEEHLEEDLKIQVDLVESKDKYKGRKKLPPVDLPRSELEKQKENAPKQQNASGKKKRFVEEETEKKLEYADW